MAEPSRRITRFSSDPAAPAGPAVGPRPGYLSDHRAPLILRGTSAAFTVAPCGRPRPGPNVPARKDLGRCGSPASSPVASRKPALSSAGSPGSTASRPSPRARPDRARHARQGPWAPGQPVRRTSCRERTLRPVTEMAIELPVRYGPDALSAALCVRYPSDLRRARWRIIPQLRGGRRLDRRPHRHGMVHCRQSGSIAVRRLNGRHVIAAYILIQTEACEAAMVAARSGPCRASRRWRFWPGPTTSSPGPIHGTSTS